MKKRRIIIIVVIAAVVIGIVTFLIVRAGRNELQLRTAVTGNEAVEITVTATGYIQPVEKVDVGTQVSGVIEKIYVDYNSQVKKGQLLAELDKLTLNEKVNQAQASLESSQSDMVFAQQTYDRIMQLYNVKAATQSAFEEASNRLAQARTAVINAQANLHQAQVNLGYAEIYSPIDGVVLNREVEQGQTVAASFNTPTLFTIANDLTKMQVEADVDEADIGKVKLGQKVTFTVDAYNDEFFEGEVNQIRLQPTVTNNVVTYTVIVEAPNPQERLFPGMTASITIIAESGEGLSVPVAATRFFPSQEVMEKMNLTEIPRGRREPGKSTVWVKQADGNIAPRNIDTGLSDGVNILVISGLNPGEEVVLSAVYGKASKNNTQQATANPLMPQRPGGGRR